MKSLRNGPDTLIWTRYRSSDQYELRAEGEAGCFALLTRQPGFVFLGQTLEGSVKFSRVGFQHPRVTVRDTATDLELATLHLSHLGDGVLEGVGGRSWSWKLLSFWRQERAFLGPGHEMLVGISPEITGAVRVVVSPVARSLRELPIMVMLGACVAWLTVDESAAMTAAITAATL